MKTTQSRLSARLLCGAGAAAILAMSSPARAEVRQFDIPSQSLGEALARFGAQSDLAVVSTSELTRSKSSQAVTGAIEPEVALAQLLNGTGLTYRRDGDTFLIVSASDPQSGSAAGDGAEGTVQALIVTAQKREEDIQDVPIAISAFTQEDLTRSQVAGGPDLMTQVPNFTFTKTNFSSYSIQIRGIGTQAISVTTDPAVAVAFNNTPFVRNRFFEQEFYDLQRIEVLRGPQGTLYGRNATAGVVNIISAKPNLGNFEAKLSGDVSNYNSTRLEGMVNLPIVEDKVAFRMAGAWTKRDGYVVNSLTGNPIDGRDLWSVRASLRFEPTDKLSANLIYEHFEENDDRLRSGKQLCKTDNPPEGPASSFWDAQTYYSQGCAPTSLYSPEAFQVPNGFSLPYYGAFASQTPLPIQRNFDAYASRTQSRDLRVIESTVDPHYRADSDLAELQVEFDLSDQFTLASETSYGTDFIFSTQDFNRFNTAPGAFLDDEYDGQPEGVLNNGYFCDPQVGCANRIVLVDLSTAKSTQFSQEFRLSSDFDGPFNFSAGVNFLRYDTTEKYYIFFNTLTAWAAVWPEIGATYINHTAMPDYVAGVSDNRQCLRKGMVEGPFSQSPGVTGCIYIDPNPIESLNDLGHNYFLSKNQYKLLSYAAFGEVYYDITPELKLTAGLRWTVDKKEAPRTPSWLLAADSVGYPVRDVERQEWREPTGRLALDWKPALSFTDQTLLYASYAHGYKAGGSNPPPAMIAVYSQDDRTTWESVVQPKTFEPEFLDAYEIGTKNTLAGGQITANLSAFYYDYKSYQISQILNRSAVNYNFDAEVWGAELEADWRPLENLRLGLKLGYEKTRVGDGERAIDTMDRTAGEPNWVVSRPFITVPSNCILPRYVVYPNGVGPALAGTGNGLAGMCVYAYGNGLDPVTLLPYVANPTQFLNVPGPFPPQDGLPWPWVVYPNAGYYPGFNPATAPNHGEGIFKDLGGNELPNAPHYTATVTADYTLPLPHDWLMTLHSDLYYQSEAWTRIFNMPGYDKLKAYYNVNLAAIFTNEDAGWKVMAYVKNVLDADNITGAFLNSDDTGLTTNVFLNEPRLYGLRVTKEWTGAPWWTSNNHPAGEPWPFTVELGGMVQRQDAPNAALAQELGPVFAGHLDPLARQDQDLDWGDGREVKLTYNPGAWRVSLSARFGKTKLSDPSLHNYSYPEQCAFVGTGLEPLCDREELRWGAWFSPSVYENFATYEREDHTVVDFAVGRDFGFGGVFEKSAISAGLRYARLSSRTDVQIQGVPQRVFESEDFPFIKYNQHDVYTGKIAADREFEGAGPAIDWEAAKRLFGSDASHLDLAWSAGGGVLFGKQRTDIQGGWQDDHYRGKYLGIPQPEHSTTPTAVSHHRSDSVTVPVLDLGAGLSWEINRFKVGAGYRWERYFDAIDGGYDKHESYDRTIDGPYVKIAVGFGG